MTPARAAGCVLLVSTIAVWFAGLVLVGALMGWWLR